MEITFCDLRAKEVVNICDGKLLGNIIDIAFDSCSARITGIVVPGEKTFFSFFKSHSDIYIPFNRICKIGKDVILVELNPVNTQNVKNLNKEQPQTANILSLESSETENTTFNEEITQ